MRQKENKKLKNGEIKAKKGRLEEGRREGGGEGNSKLREEREGE